MLISKETCIDCGICVTRCPVGAIKTDTTEGIQIDFDECVECGVCKRLRICPTEAIYQQPLVWPRTIRSLMSDELVVAEETGISGRGTEEMKTNDVTGRFKHGWAGIAIELGRPGIATRMYEMEKVAMAVAKEGVEFEKLNPITSMMSDLKTGKFKDELLNERVLSGVIELLIPLERVPAIINRLKEIEPQLDTVFSLGIISRVAPDGSYPHVKVIEELGIWISPNGKNNVGLGRPLAKED
ncbi:MAG: 4Fe-4S binding protein [Syntrophomonadaceae bacterium]|nr:4Fe-4S binding protein [Syntrophomonadaceae bacterium]